jgi:hypothetical protein
MSKGRNTLTVLHIDDLANKQGFRSPYATGDESWSLVEAAEIETPTGEVHLHWMNHRGKGHWRFSSKGTTVCNTVRCRVVTITPHGGEHESCPIDGPDFASVQEAWWARKKEENMRELELRNFFNRKRDELYPLWRKDMSQLKVPPYSISFHEWRENLI